MRGESSRFRHRWRHRRTSSAFTATELDYPSYLLQSVSDDGRTLTGVNRYIRDGAVTEVVPTEGNGTDLLYLTPDGTVAIGKYGRPYPHGNMLLAYSPEFGVVDFYKPERRMMQFRGLDPDGTVWISYGGVGPYPPGGFKWKHPGPEIPVTGDEMPPYVAFDGVPTPIPDRWPPTLSFASPNRQWAVGSVRVPETSISEYYLWSSDGSYTRLPDEFAPKHVHDSGNLLVGVAPPVQGYAKRPWAVWLRGRGLIQIDDALVQAGAKPDEVPGFFFEVAGASPDRTLYICSLDRGFTKQHFLLRVGVPEP